MNELIRDKVCIAGVGETEYSRDSGRSEATLACEAIRTAMGDAGLEIKEIDGIVKYEMDSTSEAAIATSLGIPNLRYFGSVGYGGGGSGATIVHGAMAIALGLADVVVCFRALNGSSGRGGGSQALNPVNYGDPGFGYPFGLITPPQMYAMLARRHMHEYGTTHEHFGAVSVAHRRHAATNPRAQLKKAITMEQYLESRWIAEPFRLFDCCLQTDGGAAVVLVSAERAGSLRAKPVYIVGAAQGTGPLPCAGHNRPDLTEFQATAAADELWRQTGLSAKDVDVALLYDHFTFFVLVALESFGFCKLGEGGPFVEGGRIEIDGELPVNPHGGLLAEGYIHGMNHIVEAVRQLRGEAVNQVKGAEIALYAGAAQEPTAAFLLRN